MSDRVKIDHGKFKDVFLGKIPHNSLDRYEKVMYAIYVWGIQDGREIAILEAISKIDPELADELTGTFVGSEVAKLITEAMETADKDE